MADGDGNIVFWNKAAYEMFGYTQAETAGQPLTMLMPEPFKAPHRSGLERFKATSEAIIIGKSVELSGKRKDGTEFPLELSLSSWTSDDGQYFAGMIRDITERAVMKEIEHIMSSSLDIESVYEDFAQHVHELIPFDRISINIVDLQEGIGRTAYTAGLEVEERVVGDTYSLTGSAAVFMLQFGKGIVVHPDNEGTLAIQYPTFVPGYKAGLRSFLSVPLISKGRTLGGLHLRSKSLNAYSDRHLNQAETIATLISQAIANSQLYGQLIQAEKRYSDIFENAVEGISQTTPDGRYLTVNPAYAKMLGYASPEELLTSITDMRHQVYVDPNRRDEILRLVEERGSARGVEAQMYRKDGSVIWPSRSGRVVRDPQGAVSYYEAIVEDITERKRAEEELRAEHKGLQAMAETSPVGVFGVDAATRTIHFVNRELERILQFVPDPNLGLDQFEVAFTRRRPDGGIYGSTSLPIERALSSGEIVNAEEVVFEFPDGRVVRTLVNATPVYSEDGQITAAIATVHEMTSAQEMAPPTNVLTAAGVAQARENKTIYAETALKIEFGFATDSGRVRNNNEDAVYCEPGDSIRAQDRGWLCIVADGMGGQAAGDVASTLAVRTVAETYYASSGSDALAQAVQEANRAVYTAGQQRPEHRGMGTTLTCAIIAGTSIKVAHVGDSRAYLIRGGQTRRLTRDHSWVAELVRAGALTDEQSKIYRYHNLLSRALGRKPDVEVDIEEYDLAPGDRIILCSDGLSNLVGDSEIAQAVTLQSAQLAADSLLKLANDRGGEDNISVIVAECN